MADALFLLALAYRIVCGVAGCYIAARLTPDRPLQHKPRAGRRPNNTTPTRFEDFAGELARAYQAA